MPLFREDREQERYSPRMTERSAGYQAQGLVAPPWRWYVVIQAHKQYVCTKPMLPVTMWRKLLRSWEPLLRACLAVSLHKYADLPQSVARRLGIFVKCLYMGRRTTQGRRNLSVIDLPVRLFLVFTLTAHAWKTALRVRALSVNLGPCTGRCCRAHHGQAGCSVAGIH